jgi:hypothetical protein
VFTSQDAAVSAKDKLRYDNILLSPGPVDMNRLLEAVQQGKAWQ